MIWSFMFWRDLTDFADIPSLTDDSEVEFMNNYDVWECGVAVNVALRPESDTVYISVKKSVFAE
jgi:hypothetical protein